MADKLYPIPTLPGMGRGLVNHDERSRLYPASAVVPTDQTRPRTKGWRRGRAYNQGQTPHCVAFTAKGILNSYGLLRWVPWITRSRYDTTAFYYGAQDNDEWPGTAYDGTSGLGMCRWLLARGYINEYRWCFGLNDVLLTLSHVGPVGLGVWWYGAMFAPDSDGLLHVEGERMGGHEVELTGIDVFARTVTVTNSWGIGWGRKGKAKLRWDDLDRLLHEDGDAFVIVR